MDGKEAIIERILSDAETKSKAIISDAENKVKEKLDDAKGWAEEYTKAQDELLQKELKGIVEKRITNGELDVKKALLKKKQDLIDKAFDESYVKLCSLDKAEYLSYVKKLILSCVEDGDEVILSNDGKITEKDLADIKGITVSKKLGTFIGGVILKGKVCDKDLTFKTIVEEYKEDLTSKVANILFNSEK